MASIFRDKKRSQYYIACYRGPNGERLQNTTKQTDRIQAQAIAVEWEQAALKARKGELAEEQAREVVNNIVQLAGGDPMVNHTIRSWFGGWIQDIKVSRADGTAKRYERLKDEFLDTLGPKADKNIAHLSDSDIQKFRDFLIAEGEAPASVNLVLKALRSVLTRALDQGYVKHNRAKAVSFVKSSKKSKIKRAFTLDEIERILAHAPDQEWSELTQCGYYIADRIGTLVNLRFENFNLTARTVTYTPGKQKSTDDDKEITAPIHPVVVDLVEKRGKSSGYLFPTLRLKRVGGKTGLSLTFRDIIDAAGIKYATTAARGPSHQVVIGSFAMASRLVTNREYESFIEDGGYERSDLWLSLGWNAVKEKNWKAPLYWEKDGGSPPQRPIRRRWDKKCECRTRPRTTATV